MAEIKRMFTPEFRNRLDAVISFAALDEEVILRVVDKFLMQLEAQLLEKKVEALFTEDLKKYLAKNGFDPLMGARPMARLIQDTIRRALADELLFGKLANGGRVTIDVDDDGKVKLDIAQSAQPAEPPVESADWARACAGAPGASGRFSFAVGREARATGIIHRAASIDGGPASFAGSSRRSARAAARSRSSPPRPPRRLRRPT